MGCSSLLIKFVHKIYRSCLLVFALAALCSAGSGTASPRALDSLENSLEKYSREKLPEFSRATFTVTVLDDFGKLVEWEKGGFEFRVGKTLANFRPVGTVVFPVDVFRDRERVDAFFVKAQVRVYQVILVAGRSVSRGEKIGEQDVVARKEDVALLPVRFFTDRRQVIGKEARMSIPKDRVLLSWMVRDEPMVHQSAGVTLVAQKGNVRVEAAGKALEDGQMGEEIRVKNNGSAKIFQARVIGPSLVEVLK